MKVHGEFVCKVKEVHYIYIWVIEEGLRIISILYSGVGMLSNQLFEDIIPCMLLDKI